MQRALKAQQPAGFLPCKNFGIRHPSIGRLGHFSKRILQQRPLPTHPSELHASTLDRTDQPQTVDEPEKASKPYVWTDQWYPLAQIEDLSKSKPNAFQLLGKGVVVWYDPQMSSWRAFRDLCPHRLIPLSEGRINEKGRLECGYHGWEFNGSGACEHIPQALPNSVGHKSARACVESYPVAVKQGLLWVKPTNIAIVEATGGPREDLIPIVDEVDNEPGWIMRTVVRDIPYDFATLLENVLDVSHVPFTHHGSVGNRKNATPVDLEVTRRGEDGFEGLWPDGPRKGMYGPQTSRFIAPIMMRHKLDAAANLGFSTMTVVYAVPTAPGRSRLIARFPFLFKNPLPRLIFTYLPRWATHPNEMLILEDDQLFLHQQEREVAQLAIESGRSNLGSLYYMPTSADAFVTAFRSWISRVGGGGPFGPTTSQEFLRAAGPRMSDAALLDRYHSHTKNCASCSKALSTIEGVQSALRLASPFLILSASFAAATAAAGGAAGPLASLGLAVAKLWLGSGVLGAAAMLAWIGAAALEGWRQKFIVGSYPPPRNFKK